MVLFYPLPGSLLWSPRADIYLSLLLCLTPTLIINGCPIHKTILASVFIIIKRYITKHLYFDSFIQIPYIQGHGPRSLSDMYIVNTASKEIKHFSILDRIQIDIYMYIVNCDIISIPEDSMLQKLGIPSR